MLGESEVSGAPGAKRPLSVEADQSSSVVVRKLGEHRFPFFRGELQRMGGRPRSNTEIVACEKGEQGRALIASTQLAVDGCDRSASEFAELASGLSVASPCLLAASR